LYAEGLTTNAAESPYLSLVRIVNERAIFTSFAWRKKQKLPLNYYIANMNKCQQKAAPRTGRLFKSY